MYGVALCACNSGCTRVVFIRDFIRALDIMDPNFTIRVWLIVAVCRLLYVSCACPAGWDQGYGGSCYKLGDAQGSWKNAKHACESELHGHLLFVDNQTELNIVAELLNNKGIGMAFYIHSLWGKTLHQLWISNPNHCFAMSHIQSGYAEVEASCNENYPFVCKTTMEAVCAAQDLPTVDHSANDGNLTHSNRYTAGDVVTYTCHPGYALKDESQYTKTCTADHTFSGAVPECLRLCPLSALPNVTNSLTGGASDYKEGDEPVYTCKNGFTFVTDSRTPLNCSADGTFTGTAPECKDSSLQGTEGGNDSCEAADACCVWCSGKNGDCYCDPGCVRYGDCCYDYESYCVYGNTTNPTSLTCTPDVVSDSTKSPDQATHNYNTSVVYSCNVGYDHTVGDLTRTCCADGTWTGTTPVCTHTEIDATCTPDVVLNSGKTLDQATYDYNTAVVYSCNAGYDHVSGNLSRTCKEDTTWTGTAPACKRSLEPICFPNGTVIVNNPDATELISAHAWTTDKHCNATWIASADNTQPKETLKITGCDVGSDVSVAFSTRYEDDEMQVGYGFMLYLIQCNEIDVTGVALEFTLGLEPVIMLNQNTMPSVSPTITIVSNFRYTSATGPITTTAKVGDKLYWTIDIPEQYTAVPIRCTAYAGTSASGSVFELLIHRGCTFDNYILQSFSDAKIDTSVPDIKRYYTTLWVFKFYTSDFMLFQCSLNLCRASSTDCEINCGGHKKRRGHVTDAEVAHGKTSRVLRINKAVDASSSATKIKSRSPGMIVVYVAVAWLLKLLLH